MKGLRGFRIGGKLKTAFRWIIRRRINPNRLVHSPRSRCLNPVSRLSGFLRRGAKSLFFGNSDPGYIRLGQAGPKPVSRGHLAVYVGESGGDTRRVVVPLIYFKHPLFGELLKEAERVYGYDYPGGITIPCGFSQFEKVKMSIAKWYGFRRRRGN